VRRRGRRRRSRGIGAAIAAARNGADPNAASYAAGFVPAFTDTQGGPLRNRKPIPSLYSGGELGAIYSWGYQGGGNILECIVFGTSRAIRLPQKNCGVHEP
jgi:hypothetical protein